MSILHERAKLQMPQSKFTVMSIIAVARKVPPCTSHVRGGRFRSESHSIIDLFQYDCSTEASTKILDHLWAVKLGQSMIPRDPTTTN